MSTPLYPAASATVLAAGHVDAGTASLANTAVIALIVLLVIVRQFTTRPVTPWVFVWVALLLVRGVLPPGPVEHGTAGIVVLVLELAVSVTFGVLRGRTVRVWRDVGGVARRRGGMPTFLLWLATIAARLAISGIAGAAVGVPFNVSALWLGFGVTLGIQHAIVLARARALPRVVAAPGVTPVG